MARARNVTHYYRLRDAGVTLIERETFDSALMSARSVLELMGWQPHAARNQALRFRRHNIELMEQMAPHFGDERQADRDGQARAPAARGAVGGRSAQQRREQHARAGWQAPRADSGDPPSQSSS